MMNLIPARCPLSERQRRGRIEPGVWKRYRGGKKYLKKAILSLTLQVWGANLLFPGMGNISKRDGQKGKRETHREREKN